MVSERGTPEYLEILNDVLRDASAAGAYSVGIVSCLAWQANKEPDRELLQTAAKCQTPREALNAFYLWGL